MTAYTLALAIARSKHHSAQSWKRFARAAEQSRNAFVANIIADVHASAARDFILLARSIRMEGKP